MPTMPITAMFVLTSAQGNYVIFQYADQSRSNPEKLTDAKHTSLIASLTNAEYIAYARSRATPDHWVNV